MRNAVIYARFSSDKQTEDSIEAQVKACEEYRQSMSTNENYTTDFALQDFDEYE